MASKPPLICPQRHHQTLLLHLLSPSTTVNKDDVIKSNTRASAQILRDHLTTGPVEAMQVLLLADAQGEIEVEICSGQNNNNSGRKRKRRKRQILDWQSSASAIRFVHDSLSRCFERSNADEQASAASKEINDEDDNDNTISDNDIMSRDLCRNIQRLNDLLSWRYDEQDEQHMVENGGLQHDGIIGESSSSSVRHIIYVLVDEREFGSLRSLEVDDVWKKQRDTLWNENKVELLLFRHESSDNTSAPPLRAIKRNDSMSTDNSSKCRINIRKDAESVVTSIACECLPFNGKNFAQKQTDFISPTRFEHVRLVPSNILDPLSNGENFFYVFPQTDGNKVNRDLDFVSILLEATRSNLIVKQCAVQPTRYFRLSYFSVRKLGLQEVACDKLSSVLNGLDEQEWFVPFESLLSPFNLPYATSAQQSLSCVPRKLSIGSAKTCESKTISEPKDYRKVRNDLDAAFLEVNSKLPNSPPVVESPRKQHNVARQVDPISDHAPCIVSTISDFEKAYDDCIDHNEPKLDHFIHCIFPSALSTCFSDDAKKLSSTKVYVRTEHIIAHLQNRDFETADCDQMLRIIKAQVMMRLQILVLTGFEPVDREQYNTTNGKKKKTKRHKANRRVIGPTFIEQIIKILSQAAFLLGPEVTFASFLEETVARRFESLPVIVRNIYVSFEVVLPAAFLQKARGVCTSDQSISSHSIRNKKVKLEGKHGNKLRLKRNSTLDSQVSNSSASIDSKKRLAFDRMRLAHEQKEMKLSSGRDGSAKPITTIQKLGKSKLFSSSVKLAQRHKSSNPMLVGSRREYVGGHFTNKLSNVSTLFREVKAVPKKVAKKSKLKPRRKFNADFSSPSKAKSRNLHGTPQKTRFSEPRRNLGYCMSPTLRSLASPTKKQPRAKVIMETPVKAPRKSRCSIAGVTIAETPEKSPVARRASSVAAEVARSRRRKRLAQKR